MIPTPTLVEATTLRAAAAIPVRLNAVAMLRWIPANRPMELCPEPGALSPATAPGSRCAVRMP
jgi:hypothetical protein